MSVSDHTTVTRLARASRHGLIDTKSGARVLGLSPKVAASRLGSLARRGWMRRVRRGLYFVLPLETETGKPVVFEDSWVLAREAFPPCYIGGWTAAEYWELTEQIFRETLVITAAPLRTRTVTLLGHEFRLFSVPESRVSSVAPIWRGRDRVPVSDRERTIVDCLRHPELGGGIRHIAHIMREYGSSKEHNFKKVISTAGEAANGAAWKRLGYLAELLWPGEKALIAEALEQVTTGYVALDPTVRVKGRLIRRWGLRVNVSLQSEASDS